MGRCAVAIIPIIKKNFLYYTSILSMGNNLWCNK